MRRAAGGWGVAAALVLGTTVARAEEPPQWTIDHAKSEIVAFVYRDGVAARFAHDHVICAKEFSVDLEFDRDRPEELAIAVVIDAKSLTADEPALVRKHKVKNDLGPEDRAEVERTLKGEDQLHVKKYPTIRFESTGATVDAEGQVTLVGRLTIRGVTREVKAPIKIEQEVDQIRGVAQFAIKQTWFGYEPFSTLLGAVRVEDRVTLRVELVAHPAKASGEEPAPTPPPQPAPGD